jgi:hypothetical protein
MSLSDGQTCNTKATLDRCSIKRLKSRLSCLRRDTDYANAFFHVWTASVRHGSAVTRRLDMRHQRHPENHTGPGFADVGVD